MSSTNKPTAIVLGASRGIGQGLVGKLTEAGYDTYGTVRSGSTTSTLFKADLTDAASLKSAASALSDAIKSKSKGAEPALDLLVVSGAIAPEEPYLTLTPERHLEVYDTNVAGPLRAIQAFLPLLRTGSTKHILIISSLVGNANFIATNALNPKSDRLPLAPSPYPATKASLNLLGTGVYTELEDEGFKITLVHPGLVESDMAAPTISRLREEAERKGGEVAFPSISIDESTSGLAKVVKEVSQKAGADLRLVDWKGDALPW